MGNKSNLTIEIENHLIRRFQGTSIRYATEVPLSFRGEFGIIDFVTAETFKFEYSNSMPKITCYEIKISWSDFKSKNGHNFFGDDNYYVMPRELYDKVMKEYKKNFGSGEVIIPSGVGIYVYQSKRLYLKMESHSYRNAGKVGIEERFSILDSILQRWIAGRVIETPLLKGQAND